MPPSDPWPESLDALIAAKDHHRLILENDAVRVLETRIEPGHTVPLHTHRWPSVNYILSSSDILRRDERAEITFDSRTSGPAPRPGQAVWLPPLGPHTLENVGRSLVHVISVEIKPARP